LQSALKSKCKFDDKIYRKREDFVEKGVDQDVIDLRYKHFRTRQIDTINRVLDERRTISEYFLRFNSLEMREQVSRDQLRQDQARGRMTQSKS
jgi:hypothetical protein